MPPYSFLLKSSTLLLLTVTSCVLLNSTEILNDHYETFLSGPYHDIISVPLGADGGPREEFAFGSRDHHTFPQVETTFILQDEEQATRVRPRTILDYMRHQLRFRGRTKKSAKK